MLQEFPQCHGKNRYTRNEAERKKANLGRVRGKDMRVYQCPDCRGWHLTKKHRDYNVKETYEGMETARKVR